MTNPDATKSLGLLKEQVDQLAAATGLKVELKREDVLYECVVEALNYLQVSAPSQAFDALHRGLAKANMLQK